MHRIREADEWVLVADRDVDRAAAVCAMIGRIGWRARAAMTGADALEAVHGDVPALVILELELAEPSGCTVCRELREEYGESLPIVFVTATRTTPQDEIAALLLGADDYFAVPLEEERFLVRIRRLLARRQPLRARGSLTHREREVLGLLVDGYRTAEIAEHLCITHKTTTTHIEHILGKLGAHSQAQAVAFAVRDRLQSGA